MITAAMALEQNREVFAIPSPLDPHTPNGTNLLIKRGEALLVEHPEEIVQELAPLVGACAARGRTNSTTVTTQRIPVRGEPPTATPSRARPECP